jgi:catechol 2,3-dioxygenase-like lactoylglutathione lyase family enzyme
MTMANARLNHIAIRAKDPEFLARFYGEVFGMEVLFRSPTGSVYITDGYVNLALLKNRSQKPMGINHFGFQIDDMDETLRRLAEAGVPVPQPGPHDPPFAEKRGTDLDGNLFDLSVHGYQIVEHQIDRKETAGATSGRERPDLRAIERATKSTSKIRHVGMVTPNSDRLRRFYENVFDMKCIYRSETPSNFMSDGYMNLALNLNFNNRTNGLGHFGFKVADNAEICDRFAKAGLPIPFLNPNDRPFAELKGQDPEGNKFDISVHGYEKNERHADRAAKQAQKTEKIGA